jgi:hypothetical protein
MRRFIISAVLAATLAVPAFALSPGYEHFVITAGRGPGANGSMWATDLHAFNPNDFPVTVDIYWLFQNQNNASATPVTVTIPARRSVTVKDVIKTVFGQDRAFGGFRIVGREGIIAGSVYLYDMNGPSGQTMEAIPVEGGIYTASAAKRASNLPLTHIFGIEENAEFRTNFLGVGVDASGTTFNLRVFDADGAEVLAADGIALGPWEPKLWPLASLGLRNLTGGYIQVTVTSGGAMFGAAKISNRTNDPHTLEQWVPLGQ